MGRKLLTELDDLGPAERDLRLLSLKAAQVYAPSKFDLFLARFKLVPLWVAFLFVCSIGIQVAPIIIKELGPRSRLDYTRFAWWGFVLIVLMLTLPMLVVLTEWRPCPPLNAKLPGALPTVDVVIPTYQETLRDIVDTIVSTQRVEYAEDKMVAYILDDAARDDVKRICGELSGSGLLRYKLVYVRRPRNKGKKGGNLNNWLRKYEAQSGEFFVVLDADMQPFPDMLDILIGHYYGLPVETQERIAYIQTPQWYRNNLQSNKWHDAYNLSEFFFYRLLQPALSHHGCTVYVGFHRRFSDRVRSSSLPHSRPEGALARQPALIEQRLRWYHGLCQMFRHHNGYFFAKGLTFHQRVMYFIASANYISNIVLYLAGLAGTMVLFGTIAYFGFTSQLNQLTLWAFWAGVGVLFGTFFIWTLLPGCSFSQFYFTANAMFLYTPVYVAALLRFYCGIKLRVQDSASEDTEEKRWHPFFLMPIFTLTIVTAGAVTAMAGLLSSRKAVPPAPAVTIPVWWLLWVWLHLHAIYGMAGFKYADEEFYSDEAEGRLSDAHIQRKISEHQRSVHSSRASSRYSSRRGSRPGSRATSLPGSPDTSGEIEYRVGLEDESKSREPGRDGDSFADNSLLSAVIGKLNVMIARRSAVDDHMEKEKQRMGQSGHRLPSGSVQNQEMFDKKLLGRVSSRHHSEAYLSNTSRASSGGGIVPPPQEDLGDTDAGASGTSQSRSEDADEDMEQVYGSVSGSSADRSATESDIADYL